MPLRCRSTDGGSVGESGKYFVLICVPRQINNFPSLELNADIFLFRRIEIDFQEQPIPHDVPHFVSSSLNLHMIPCRP